MRNEVRPKLVKDQAERSAAASSSARDSRIVTFSAIWARTPITEFSITEPRPMVQPSEMRLSVTVTPEPASTKHRSAGTAVKRTKTLLVDAFVART